MRDVVDEIDLFIARVSLMSAEHEFTKAKKEFEEAKANYDYLLNKMKEGRQCQQ